MVLLRLLRLAWEGARFSVVLGRDRIRPTRPRKAPGQLPLVLARLGPAFIKFGQALSLRRDLLPDAYTSALQGLQEHVAPFPTEDAVGEIERALRCPVATLFARFDYQPLAAASIAQVHAARMHDGREVIVKVSRPNIKRMIDQDMRALTSLTRYIVRLIPPLRHHQPLRLISEIWANLRKEADFCQEARNITRFSAAFAQWPTIQIRRVVDDLTSESVLVQERGMGVRIDDPAVQTKGPQLARNFLDAYLHQLFVLGIFHGDPHPGNIFITSDGRICFHDFGLVGVLDQPTRRRLGAFTTAFIRQDADWLLDAAIDLGIFGGDIDRRAYRRGLAEIIADYAGLPISEWSLAEAFLRVLEAKVNVNLQWQPDGSTDIESFEMGRRSAVRGWASRPGFFVLKNLLRRIIRNGQLTLIAPDGRIEHIGKGISTITVRIGNGKTAWRVFLNPELALGEAYMDGTVTVENGSIYDFLELCLANLGWGYGHWPHKVYGRARRLMRRIVQFNPVPVARRNVAHHYDLSDSLYDLFLCADRQYSCAYFMTLDDSLEAAQDQKKRHIAAKLLLCPGQRVLDIGSGWGGLGLYLASEGGVDVTGITLSMEQHRYANDRARNAGLDARVRFLLRDYREEHGRYERIVSVGMFEHVGVGHYREYFTKVRDLLTEDGVALIHTIGRCDGPGAANPWINKYIFPGGYIPALSEIVPAIERAGLHVTDIEVLRLHYAETLRAWRERFLANRDGISAIYDERFCRMWEFYLASCEASFRHSGLVVFQIQLARRVDAVPLTREYISAWEQARPLPVTP